MHKKKPESNLDSGFFSIKVLTELLEEIECSKNAVSFSLTFGPKAMQEFVSKLSAT